MIHLTATTKIVAGAVALSLGWIVLAACDCENSDTREDAFPGFWVTCIDNMPTLMTYSGNSPTIVTANSSGNFNQNEYDCSRDSSSPQYKNSETSASLPLGSQVGPSLARPRAGGGTSAYVPEPVRDLPFSPDVPPLGTANCQASFPDVLHTNHNENSVTRIPTCPFGIKATIPVFANPLQVAVTPDGSTALVTSYGPLTASGGAVTYISLSNNQVTNTVMMSSGVTPNGLAISPDGTTAYIGNFRPTGQSILVMDIASQTITATIPNVVTYPSGLTLTPDGSQLWVASPVGMETDVLDTLSQTIVFRLNVQQSTDIAFNSTGTMAYITSALNTPGQVFAVNTSTYQVVNTYTVGNTPSDISMSYGDRFLVVNNETDVIVSVIDLQENAVKSVQAGASPRGIAFLR
jgi:DNA-binding beta-propeller fold protein YncE